MRQNIISIALQASLLFHASAFAQKGSFNILTYNIAGLPEPLSSSDPIENTPVISGRLGEYDIVNVQEDFQYHRELIASDKHPHRTETTGTVPIGSGLNTLSNFPWTDLQRKTWKACWFGSADCLTPKGFTAMRMQINTGVSVDIYNLHAEAGDGDLDFAARKIGIQQLSDFINSYSNGNAVIIFGDMNMRFYEARDVVRILTDKNGLTDVWTQLIRGGTPPTAGSPNIECPFPVAGNSDLNCEVIDKVMYRSSSRVKLTATQFRNENAKFLRADGGPLSDHFPIAVNFDYEVIGQAKRFVA